jgi:hypothetical protein
VTSSSSLGADDDVITVEKTSSQSEESGESETLMVGTTRAEFLEFIKKTAEQRGTQKPELLQQIVAKALDEGQNMQRAEIEQLRNLLEKPPAKGLFPPKNELASVPDLISKATNPGITVKESRDLAKDTFKLFAALTEAPEVEEERIPVPGKGLIPTSSLRQRLKVLEQHEAASCVEYRLFAVALSNDDSLEGALGSCFIEDKQQAARSSSAFFSRVTSAPGMMPMPGMPMPGMPMAGMGPGMPMFEMSLDTVDGVPNFEAMKPPDLADLENRVLRSWLPPLADLLGSSKKAPSTPKLPPGMVALGPGVSLGEEASLFPLFLTSVASQGNFEPLIVYYLSRLVGRFNVQAVARSVSRAQPLKPDEIVTEQESKYLSRIQQEAFEKAGSSLGFSLFLSSAFSLFVLYAIFSTLYGLVSGIFAPPPVDPLSF